MYSGLLANDRTKYGPSASLGFSLNFTLPVQFRTPKKLISPLVSITAPHFSFGLLLKMFFTAFCAHVNSRIPAFWQTPKGLYLEIIGHVHFSTKLFIIWDRGLVWCALSVKGSGQIAWFYVDVFCSVFGGLFDILFALKRSYKFWGKITSIFAFSNRRKIKTTTIKAKMKTRIRWLVHVTHSLIDDTTGGIST